MNIVDAISEFFSGTSLIVYICIFLGRLIDVSASTVRIVLINRGERVIGSLVAIIEVTVWLFVARSVLSGDVGLLKIVVYAIAFAIGTYAGSVIEEKLALGLSEIQVIVSKLEDASAVRQALRGAGFGVTTIEARGGDDSPRFMLVAYVRRCTQREAVALINASCANALVTVSDVVTQKGGFMRANPSRRKKHCEARKEQ